MRIGWSCEITPNEWVKVDLDESDLSRLLHEGGVALEAQYRISTAMAYALLDTECERMLLARLIARHNHAGRERLAALNARRAELLAQLAAMFPAPQEATPAPV